MEYMWFVDQRKIEVFFKDLSSVRVPLEIVHITNSLDVNNMAFTLDGNKIFLEEVLIATATAPQLILTTLHEYAHIKFDSYKGRTPKECYDIEYACDKWAMTTMIQSGNFSRDALYEAAKLFTDVIVGEGSQTHPPSKERYKRLIKIIEDYV